MFGVSIVSLFVITSELVLPPGGGLGAREHGISDAVKVKIKHDTHGVSRIRDCHLIRFISEIL